MQIRDEDGTGQGADASHGYLPVGILVGLCAVCEVIVEGADLGFWGQPGWRRIAIEYGGFWVGLLGNWRPNFPGQWLTMFLTHAFLHAGLSHFVTNMLTLAVIGPSVAARLGPARFLVLFLGSAFGGGLGYALILPSSSPMVGASGALFGIFGALCAWDYKVRPARDRLVFVAWIATVVVLLNLVQWWVSGGLLAWQAHVAGFVAGWILGLGLDPAQRGVSSS
jgi:membrane associated rhomboid family serine protease